MGKRGAVIARAREQVLTILQEENACTAWFRQADPDPAGVFQSLHYEIGSGKPAYIFRMADGRGEQFYKQPWADVRPRMAVQTRLSNSMPMDHFSIIFRRLWRCVRGEYQCGPLGFKGWL